MKEEGFTLIELLAVIVILAIIALIATPIVLDIIEDSKESSTKRSAELYLDGVEQAIARYQLNGKEVTSGTYYVMENGNICTTPLTDKTCTGEEITVTVDGTKPSSGTITINKGEIKSINNLYIDKKYINKKDNEIILSDEEYIEILCKAKTTVTTGNLAEGNYNYGDEYTCELGDGEEKTFYVLENNDDTVSLIMNMNIDNNGKGTTSGNTVAWCSKEDYTEAGGNEENWTPAGNNYLGSITALNYLKDSTKSWSKLNPSQISLPSAEQIATASGIAFDASNETCFSEISTWLNSYTEEIGYWTSTPFASSSYLAWGAKLSLDNSLIVADGYISGVRPVITVSKRQLEQKNK